MIIINSRISIIAVCAPPPYQRGGGVYDVCAYTNTHVECILTRVYSYFIQIPRGWVVVVFVPGDVAHRSSTNNSLLQQAAAAAE